MASKQCTPEYFQQQILAFWAAHGRHHLPWRKTKDPWRILLAELTLRKTTAAQSADVYLDLMALSPEDILAIDEDSLERMLAPLGLHRIRAGNLREIASRVADAGIDALRSSAFVEGLPGVGRYIANALRCYAFEEAVPAVDTNWVRMIQRVFGVRSTRSRPREDRIFLDFASTLMPAERVREFSWGVLDFAAAVCAARNPKCPSCPLSDVCDYYQSSKNIEAAALTRSSRGTSSNHNPTVLSLFSGAGGFDWGFHRAGFNTLLACELTQDAAHTLAQNLELGVVSAAGVDPSCLPAVIQGDIEEVDFARISLAPDVLIGGPPCQDFSVSKAHERQGLNGGRGHLYREFVRAVMYFQPKVFVFENVPGLLSANHGLAYSTILSDLRHLETTRRACLTDQASYSVPESEVQDYIILFSGIVDAVKLGVPQIRRRLIIIGLRRDLFDAFSPTDQGAIINRLELQLNGVGRFFARYPLTSLEALEGKPLPDLQNEYRSIMEAYSDLFDSVNSPKAAAWKTDVWDRLSFDIVKDYLSLQQLDNAFAFTTSEFEAAMREHEDLLRGLDWLGHPVSELDLSDGTTIPIAQGGSVIDRMYYIPPDENADFVVGTPWEVESKGISFIYRRTGPLKPAMTVMAYGGGGTHGYHYSRDRMALTLRERARIQTFTDDFMFAGKNIRAQIGEAVPPLLGERIAEAVREILECAT